MKKIGILTYHKSNNYGAFMQCYSLSTKLKALFPNESVEVVDYLSREVYSLYHPSIKNYVYMIFHALTLRRKLSYTKNFFLYLKQSITKHSPDVNSTYFDEAQRLLPLSEKQLITDNYKEVVDYLNNNYDILIVGSDAVWNWQIRPFPNVYFLGLNIKTKKLSYAASSYGQPYRLLSAKINTEIKSGWDTFDYIGVRDTSTENFVSSLTSKIKPVHNCDPTVFLDMNNIPVNRKQILEKLKKAGYIQGKKTIGIMARTWLARFVREQLGNEYQIVSVFKRSEYADVNLMDINPFEWAACFSFFDLTITHYFHGNLLSLKNGTPTIVFEQKTSYNQQYDSKIRDFMARINLLENCYYIDDLSDDFSLKDTISQIFSMGDYREVLSTNLSKEAESIQGFIQSLTRII